MPRRRPPRAPSPPRSARPPPPGPIPAATSRDRLPGPHFDAEPLQVAPRRLAQRLRKRRQHRRARLRSAGCAPTRDRSAGSSLRQRLRAISARAPAISTPVGPPPTTTKVSSARRLRRIGLALRALERQQDAAPDVERVFERLEPRRERMPAVVSEVGVRRAGRDDQVVVRRASRRQSDSGLPAASMRSDLGQEHLDVPLAAQDPADRRRDVAWRQRRPSRPGTAAAGTRGGCGGRGVVTRTGARRSAARRRARRTRRRRSQPVDRPSTSCHREGDSRVRLMISARGGPGAESRPDLVPAAGIDTTGPPYCTQAGHVHFEPCDAMGWGAAVAPAAAVRCPGWGPPSPWRRSSRRSGGKGSSAATSTPG